MRLFTCQSCGARLYFENRYCHSCDHWLGYLADCGALTALRRPNDHTDDEDAYLGRWTPLVDPQRRVRFCINAQYDACNWLIAEPAPGEPRALFCAACRFNQVIPDMTDPVNLARWRKIESAKHWLIYTLEQLGLTLPDRRENPTHGLAFQFLATLPGEPPPLTGHSAGVITLNIEEAEDTIREQQRAALGEPYRTLLGHFRHEIGHFYWDLLVRDGGRLEAFRAVFGDERADYGAALERHYAQGAPPDWRTHYISAYASAHPWEDFAESWAHYLHIIDTLETAGSYGLAVRPPGPDLEPTPVAETNPYQIPTIGALIQRWLPLTFAMNSLARSLGQADLYPFILSPAVIGKLGFIHGLMPRHQ